MGGFSGAKSDKKANKKLLEAAAEMGAPFVYMMSETKSSGGGWGGWGFSLMLAGWVVTAGF